MTQQQPATPPLPWGVQPPNLAFQQSGAATPSPPPPLSMMAPNVFGQPTQLPGYVQQVPPAPAYAPPQHNPLGMSAAGVIAASPVTGPGLQANGYPAGVMPQQQPPQQQPARASRQRNLPLDTSTPAGSAFGQPNPPPALPPTQILSSETFAPPPLNPANIQPLMAGMVPGSSGMMSAPPVQTAPVVQAQAVAEPGGKSIQQLIREFSKQAGCERYSGDAEKVKLLEEYLWIRQLTPNLSFETFLSLYTPNADFDDQNLKHPTDAIKHYLPRAKKQADERGCHHWSAKQVVDYVAIYVDIIREAERTQQPIPMSLNQHLQSQPMIDAALSGAFDEAPQPKAQGAKAQKSAPKTADKVRPTGPNQRAIYSGAGGRQHRGFVSALWQDPQSNNYYADFIADGGEEFKGIGLVTLEVCTDPPPNPPQDNEGTALPELGHGRLLVPKSEFGSVLQALALTVPVGTVAVGDLLYSYQHAFPTGHTAMLDVMNAETGPVVDAFLCMGDPNNVVAEINPPRKNIEGIYSFETPEGVFTLEVVGNR